MAAVKDAYKEYRSMLTLLDDKEVSPDDVYIELTRKEDRVLEAIKAVSAAERSTRTHDALLYNRPLMELVGMFCNTWLTIFDELVNDKMYKQPRAVLWDGDRKIFVGMMVVVLALILFFVHSST